MSEARRRRKEKMNAKTEKKVLTPFLAYVKGMMKEGNASLRDNGGARRKGIGHNLVPIRCLSG